jgi:serine/threonine protein phosphatase PrpC
MKFSIFEESRIGGRANNEDRLGHHSTHEALVMVVADGLGGHGHGEVAAEAAVRSVIGTFQRQARPRLENPQAFLADALAGAHTAVQAQARLRKLDEAPRTTCVVCVIQDGIACWAHAGDSRLYLLRNGRVLVRTLDHSRVQMLIDEGRLTAAEARSHPMRNALMSCLGGEQTPRFDFSAKQALKRGDVLLLCTDGVWGPLADETPLALLSANQPVRNAPVMLDRIEAAAGSGRDNLTLLLLAWEEAAATSSPADPAWTPEDFNRTVNTSTRRLHAKEPT